MEDKTLQTVLEMLVRIEDKVDKCLRQHKEEKELLDLIYNERELIEEILTTARNSRDTLKYHQQHQTEVQKTLQSGIQAVGQKIDSMPQEVKDVVEKQVNGITETVAQGQVLIKSGFFGKIKMLMVKKPTGGNSKGA